METHHKADVAIEEYDSPKFDVDASVPTKYHGTAADARDMAILGKKQVLRVWPTTRAHARYTDLRADDEVAQLQVRDDAGLRKYRHGILGSAACAF